MKTPYLAAVVKGTRFVVKTGRGGASVDVRRGHVAVEDVSNKSHVTIGVGQSASIEKGKAKTTELKVAGEGTLPVVLDAKGRPSC